VTRVDDLAGLTDSMRKARDGDDTDLLSPAVGEAAARLYESARAGGHGGDPFGLDVDVLGVLVEYHFARLRAAGDDADLHRAVACLLSVYLVGGSALTDDARHLADDLLRQDAILSGTQAWSIDVAQMLTAARRTGSAALLQQVITRARAGGAVATPSSV